MRGTESSWTRNKVLYHGREEQGFQTLSSVDAAWGMMKPTLAPYFKIASLPLRRFMLSLSPFSPLLSEEAFYSLILTDSPLWPASLKPPSCEMAWDVVWQSNRAWPTDIGIYFYEVDKQAPKLNIQYAPHLIFKILLKKNHIHTHTNIYIYM